MSHPIPTRTYEEDLINWHGGAEMTNYSTAVDALVKAYKLGNFEALVSIKNTIYKDFGNAVGDNIDAMAYHKLRNKGIDKVKIKG